MAFDLSEYTDVTYNKQLEVELSTKLKEFAFKAFGLETTKDKWSIGSDRCELYVLLEFDIACASENPQVIKFIKWLLINGTDLVAKPQNTNRIPIAM
ncbi:hypothetical protein AB4254_11080 [Vibrio breoganii]